MKIKVSDLIAEFLEKAGIKVVFGIIGSANSHIFDSISKRGYTQIVCNHHEQASVMAAGAYFRTCGKLSAAIVTAGAGSSNAITGVMSNWADSIPSIIISGQEQSKFLSQYNGLRMYGIQGFNSPKMVKDITNYSTTIIYPNEVQGELELAHHICHTKRPGPVWLDFPFDVQSKMTESKPWNLTSLYTTSQFDTITDINYVIEKLKESKRPLIWAGHGVRLSGARSDFRELIKQLEIPTILTWSGIDLLADNDTYYFGRAGVNGMRYSNFIVQNCDFLLAIGNRLSLLQTGYDITQFAPHAKICSIDADDVEWQKHPNKYDRKVYMDCKVFVNELQHTKENFKKTEWIKHCYKLKTKYPLIEECHKDGGQNYINSYKFLDKLSSEYLSEKAVITTDMGTGLLSGHYSMRLRPEQIMFTSLGLGEMGYGLPGAIGAAFAYPDREIICLNCDGGMMMNLQELQTIVHHNLPIKIVVFNNDGYLMIKHTQNMLFKGYRTGVNAKSGVSLPDYSKVGRGFNIPTFQLDNWGDFHDTVSNWLSMTGPSILEVFMDPEQDFLPKVKGVANEDGTITPANLEEMSPLVSYEEIKEAMIAGVSEKSKKIKR
jgi:acetolactate synthase-1/2/3 large subunit